MYELHFAVLDEKSPMAALELIIAKLRRFSRDAESRHSLAFKAQFNRRELLLK